MIAYCVRHAETEANVSNLFPTHDTKLTPRGYRQAETVAENLRNIGVEAIYSSPTLRTMETAKIIANTLGLKVSVDERLQEISLGGLAGRSYLEVRSSDPSWYKEYFTDQQKYGVEKFSQVMRRMSSLVEELASAGRRRVVLVTHLEPIRALVATALGAYGEWIRRIRINNASITMFEYASGVLRLYCVNWLPLDKYFENQGF
ncbi:MAG: histidine phosphatase family protein [Thermoprotei archaeon]